MQYQVKPNSEYAKIISISNRNPQFKYHWRNDFAPSTVIGHCNRLCDKFDVIQKYKDGYTPEQCISYFIEKYLSDGPKDFNYVHPKNKVYEYYNYGRTPEQVRMIAERIVQCCRENGIKLNENAHESVERMEDLIIGHACYETVNGLLEEERVRRYLKSKGTNIVTQLDSNTENFLDSLGVDIFLSDDKNRIMGFVQVKPISFMLTRTPDGLADKVKCFKNENVIGEFKKRYPNMFRPDEEGGVDKKIRYIFYDQERNYNFIVFPKFGKFLKIENFIDSSGHSHFSKEQLNGFETTTL